MTAASTQPGPSTRRLTCARCGTAFECGSGGHDGGCWCADEPFRMPIPADAGEDCLCHTCLRAAASSGSVGRIA